MMKFEFEREYDRNFIGREVEFKWLDEQLFRRRNSFSAIMVTGQAGVGKTSLLKQWFSSRRISYTPLWLNLSTEISDKALDDLIFQINSQRNTNSYETGLTVVIDGSDYWTQKQHEVAAAKIFNYKVVSALIFTRRKPLKLSRSQQLALRPLSNSLSGNLLRKLLSTDLTDDQVEKAMWLSKGYPLALFILSKLIKNESTDSILALSNDPLYELSNNILIPKREIITEAKPIIVSAHNDLITSLKRQPNNLHKLTSREFEILLADLLRDMGWEVELTKQTRDGGSDILAYLNTDIGRLLCLVEAKHYSEDRKIGVELVRTLYGTLCDAQANSAMLVTSSSFTSGAKEFQQKHKYQLTLRDYADVVEWILKFGTKKGNFA